MSQIKTKKYKKQRRQVSALRLIILITSGVLLIFAAVFAFVQSSKPRASVEVTGSPSLRVDKEIEDLGDRKLGQMVEVSFQLTNVGDQTLQFTKGPYIEVKEGC